LLTALFSKTISPRSRNRVRLTLKLFVKPDEKITAAKVDYEDMTESIKRAGCQEFEINYLTRLQPHKRVEIRRSS
jgi:hypothetical protein